MPLQLLETTSELDIKRPLIQTTGVLVQNPGRNRNSMLPSGPASKLALREKLHIELEAIELEIARLRKLADMRDTS